MSRAAESGRPTAARPAAARRAAARRGPGVPRVLVPLAVLGALFVVAPVVALLLAAPWTRLTSVVSGPGAWPALRLSLLTASAATVVCLLLGVPLAWVLARAALPGRRVLRALVTVPLVLPPVVGGVALLLLLGRRGLLGASLDAWFGITIPFTTLAVVIAEAFVALPFLVITVEGALRAVDVRYEEAAATLGARPATVLARVTLPMVAPGIAAGAVLCFARALGEFGATVTFAGTFPGRTTTVPVAVYLMLDTDPAAAIALSVVLLVVSVAVLASMRERWTAGAWR